MPRILLDFPWNLDNALDSYSPVLGVMRDFENLRAAHRLDPVPFISPQECADLCARIPQRRPAGADVFRPLMQLLSHCIRKEAGSCLATPLSGPADLPDGWKSSLRDTMTDVDDWRNPQILFSRARRSRWPSTQEIEIQLEPCGVKAVSGPYPRVIVCIDEYNAHRFARCDFDPWDLQRTSPPAPDAPAHQRHPCLLPKPPGLDGIPLQDLKNRLDNIHDWKIWDAYYFLPPRDWHPENVSKQDWRDGKAFQRGKLAGNDHVGPVDYKGEPWSWDKTHRHWDVQLKSGEYWSISHDGSLIAAKS